METKVCSKCEEEKRLEDFTPKENRCKSCKNEYNVRYRNENKEKVYAKCREWNNKNQDKVQESHKKWVETHEEEHKLIKKKAFNKHIAIEENKVKRKKIDRLYKNKLRNESLEFKIKDSVQSIINYHIKKKTTTTIKYLGCSIQEYIIYLESQFLPEMNWENYGIYWEIDHIIPLSKGGSFYYTNTQPLTVTENRKKSNKLF